MTTFEIIMSVEVFLLLIFVFAIWRAILGNSLIRHMNTEVSKKTNDLLVKETQNSTAISRGIDNLQTAVKNLAIAVSRISYKSEIED